jgi:hypothetical protein
LALLSVLAGVVFSVAVSGAALFSTETPPLNAGIEIIRADIIKTTAAAIVILERTVAVPRGPKALLFTLLVNRAPASVLPGCSKTAPTSTMQERKNNVYRTYNKAYSLFRVQTIARELIYNLLS